MLEVGTRVMKLVLYNFQGMTMDQIKNAMKMLRNVCQGKAKVSDGTVSITSVYG